MHTNILVMCATVVELEQNAQRIRERDGIIDFNKDIKQEKTDRTLQLCVDVDSISSIQPSHTAY